MVNAKNEDCKGLSRVGEKAKKQKEEKMENYELTDSKEKFELKINGVPIRCVIGYKVEGTPCVTKLTVELEIPKENIKVQVSRE